MNDNRQYLHFFTLNSEPFRDLKDPRFVWVGPRQAETLALLRNGVEQRKGICVLTGECGTGKSVLVDRLISTLPKSSVVAILRERDLQASRFDELLCERFGLPQGTRGDLLKSVKEFLETQYLSGWFVLLVVEDADSAGDEVLEQVRLLSNLQTPDNEKLFTILVTGTHRLEERIGTYERRAFQQRVEVQRASGPLTEEETGAYVRHRFMVAGGFLETFTLEALASIHQFSGGVPKLIDIICDHALKRACVEKRRHIDAEMIAGYAKEIRATSPLAHSFAVSEPRSKSKQTRLPLLTALALLLAVGLLQVTQRGPVQHPAQTVQPSPPPPTFSLSFEPRSAVIPETDIKKLNAAAEYLKTNQQCRVLLKCQAMKERSEYERRLAEARRKAIREYLGNNGVVQQRIDFLEVTKSGSPTGDAKHTQRTSSIELLIIPPST